MNWDWRIFARVCAGVAVINAVYHECPPIVLPEIPMPFEQEWRELDEAGAEIDRRLQKLDETMVRLRFETTWEAE